MDEERYSGRSLNRCGGERPNELVAYSDARGMIDLCYVPGRDKEDSKYWLVCDWGKHVRQAIFGELGLVESVHDHLGQGRRRTIIESPNAAGNFNVYGELPLEDEIDRVYETIAGLDFRERKQDEKELFEWRSQQLLARFGDFRQLFHSEGRPDIIPGYNDKMIIIKAGVGCYRGCIYCQEPKKGFSLYGRDEITHNIELTESLIRKYHGRYATRMTECVINCPDILYFLQFAKTNPDIPFPAEIVARIRDKFPWLQKINAFMGVPTINKAPQRVLRGLFMNELGDGMSRNQYSFGINRVLVGIESAHNPTSDFLGKGETEEDKANAIRKLHEAGFKVKAIVQVGMVGEKFFHDGHWHTSKKGLDETADFLIKTLKPMYSCTGIHDNVQVSRYSLIPGTRLEEMHKSGTAVKQFRNPSDLEEQVSEFIAKLVKHNIDVDDNYEVALNHTIEPTLVKM